jgi:hypothetical protein
MSEAFAKLPPIPGFQHCNICPPRTEAMPLDAPLAIGFGQVEVTKGDETVWQGDDAGVLLYRFEAEALRDPDHDWRVSIDGPLYSAVYQRHGRGYWVLVERGEGFA